jgi:hypothetical protein
MQFSKKFNATFVSPSTTTTWTSLNSTCALFTTLASPQGATSLVANPGQSTIHVLCSQPGTFSFTVYPDANVASTDTFSVTVTTGQCYRWHFVASNAFAPNGELKSGVSLDVNEVDPAANITARLWIVDPSSATFEEKVGTAQLPSSVWRFIIDMFIVTELIF